MVVSGTAPPFSNVEFFKTGYPADPSGHGQGQTWLATVPVGAAGTFSATLTGLAAEDNISATATSTAEAPAGAGNTSEFSANALVTEVTKPKVDAVNPASGPPGSQTTVTGEGFGATQGSSTITVGGALAEVVSWSDTKIVVIVPVDSEGGAVVVTTAQGPSNEDKSFTVVLSTWYLAEGTTAWGFNTYITIQNPNTSAVTAKVTYMNTTAEPSGKGRVFPPRNIVLPPQSQTTVDPRWDLGLTDFSTKIECLEGKTIAVDRTIFWTGPGAPSPEGHSSVGVCAPAASWYLPEGSSAWGFETWTLVENPNAVEATVHLTYMVEGVGPKKLDKKIPAFTRATYNMADDMKAIGWTTSVDASVQVSSSVPVIAEGSTYRNNRREGSCSIGASAPANDFFLAEGTTAWGFTSYVLVQNPNPMPVDVTVTYNTPGGPVVKPAITMPANSRKTIRVNDILPNTDFSAEVHGSKPIIAERSMYWGATSALGEACHASIGLAQPHLTFYMPDGQTSNGYETFTLVQNPNPGAVTVRVTYMTPTGKDDVTFNDEIPAGSRKTYKMSDKVKSGRAAIRVESLDGARPIMVERSMYWASRGAGTDTIGACQDRGIDNR